MRGKAYAIKQAKKLAAKFAADEAAITRRTLKKVPIDLTAITAFLNIKVVEHDFSDDVSGVFVREGESLFIGVNRSQQEQRKRFTIAHEIGHFVLHSDNVLHYDTTALDAPSVVLFRSEGSQGLNEIEANAFAAELLMPERLIEKCVSLSVYSIHDLAETFKVSELAMRHRLTNLGYI